MVFMNSIDTLLKIVLYQYLLNSRCVLFISEKFGNNVNLPKGTQSVNIVINSSVNSSFENNQIFKDYGCRMIILNVKNPALIFSDIEQGLKFQNETFSGRKYVVINNFFAADSILNIVKTKEIRFVSNLLIVGLKSQTLDANHSILTKYDEIYYLWTHKYKGDFPNDVYELDEWFSVNETFLNNANLFPDKLTNQYGRDWKTGFFNYVPYVIYGGNKKIKEKRLIGFEGYMLNEFFNQHNITMEPCYINKGYWGDVFDNGSVYGLRGALYLDKVDMGVAAFFLTDRMYRFYGMTLPMLRIGITCLVPAPQLTAGWLVPVLVYSNLMWKLIFVGYIIITLTIYVTELRLLSEKLKYLRSHKSVLLIKKFGNIVFAIFTQYFHYKDILRGYTGTVFITMTLFVTFFLCRSYESGLATIMTIPRYEDSINTAEDFLESNLAWGGIQVADKIMHWETDRQEKYRRAYRRYLAAPSEAMLKKLLESGNFGLLIERIPGDHYHFPFPSLEQSKQMRIMKEDLYWEYTVFLLRKSSILLPLLDSFMFKMNEAGITGYWLNQAADMATNLNLSSQTAIKYLSHYNSADRQVVVLKLAHVAGVFSILIAGNLISLLIFCLEIFYYLQCKNVCQK